MSKADRPYVILFLAPAVTVLLLLVVYPTVHIWRVSFTSFQLTAPEKQVFVGLSNFAEMFRDNRFLQGLGRSIYFTIVSTAVSFIVGFAIALLLHSASWWTSRYFRRSTLFLWCVVTPKNWTGTIVQVESVRRRGTHDVKAKNIHTGVQSPGGA